MKILVVEDNPLHQEHLYILLTELQHEIAGIVGHSAEVMPKILREQPDIIIMDIDLGEGKNGIELAEEINQLKPTPIIFSSGRTESEVVKSAISKHPVSYLAKPINKVNIEAAIELAIFKLTNDNDSDEARKPTNGHRILNETIFVKHANIISKIQLEDVDAFVVAKDRYVKIVTENEDYLFRSSIKEVLAQVPDHFIQTHRSTIINLKKLISINDFEGTVLVGKHEYAMSQTFKKEIFQKINLL